jgi:hypothetical protein
MLAGFPRSSCNHFPVRAGCGERRLRLAVSDWREEVRDDDGKDLCGRCHCGRVRFEVTTDPGQAITCNCSKCAKHGLWLTFVMPEHFTLQSGLDALAEYRFNTNVIQHMFCSTCGVESFARGRTPDGKEMVAVNVRCLDGVDIATLSPTPFDGRSR